LSVALQRDHQVLFVTSDRLEGDWTHHWLFATACAPDGTWERLTEALRVGVAQVAYGGEMEVMVASAKLERSLCALGWAPRPIASATWAGLRC